MDGESVDLAVMERVRTLLVGQGNLVDLVDLYKHDVEGSNPIRDQDEEFSSGSLTGDEVKAGINIGFLNSRERGRPLLESSFTAPPRFLDIREGIRPRCCPASGNLLG